MTRILFVCSRNRRRSPTAEALFRDAPGVETASAGTSPDAEHRVSRDDIEWADVIVAMEPVHRTRLASDFGPLVRHTRIVTLGVPDDYAFMDAALADRLRAVSHRFLP